MMKKPTLEESEKLSKDQHIEIILELFDRVGGAGEEGGLKTPSWCRGRSIRTGRRSEG